MSKPFSIQAPEQIAKEYAGDKQRIMQAAQMGIVDPTAAVLAGMFIDRMRAPQNAGQANPPTVAQQVMAGAPPQQPAPPPPPQMQPQMPPAGGLGATPPAQPEMPPQEMPTMAAGGMVPPYAAGGLDGLPVPDTMFDENRNGGFNDGYAGGGIVAFGGGGSANYNDVLDWLYPQIERVESGGRPRPGQPTKYGTAQGVAQMLPSTAREVASRLGLSYDANLLAGGSPEAIAYQRKLGREYLREGLERSGGDPRAAAMFYHGGPNTHLHGPKTRAYAEKVLGSGNATDTPLRDIDPANRDERQRLSLLEHINLQQSLREDIPTKYQDEYTASLEAERSPEAAKKRRKEDVWEAVGQFGAALATSPGDFLTGLSGAVAKTLPEVTASAKERKAYERQILKDLVVDEGLRRKQAEDVLEAGQRSWAADISSEEREAALRAQVEEARASREFQASEGEKNRTASLAAASARAPSERDLAMAFNTHLAQLRYRNDQGLPIIDAQGKVRRGVGGGHIADSELQKFALELAAATIQATKSNAGSSPIPGMGGGTTAGDTVDYGAPPPGAVTRVN